MTINGFLRQVGAAQRRAERNEERRQRALARMEKLQTRIDEIERAAEEMAEYQEKITQLTSIHHTIGDTVDWREVAAKLAPPEPIKSSRWSDLAITERDNFKPGFFQRLFGSEAKIRAKLEAAVVAGQKRDEVSYQSAQKLHLHQLEAWKESAELARQILAGDRAAYIRALTELEPLSEMQEMGCTIELDFPDARTVEVVLGVQSEEVVPKEAKSVTKGGKLSVKPIPDSKFNELYQDYVCGCSLRVARELLSTLPLELVIVNVTARMLDSASGHLKDLPVLSVAMPRSTIEEMRFEAVDPSDAMKLFPHRMGFKRSVGFSAIERLEQAEYPSP